MHDELDERLSRLHRSLEGPQKQHSDISKKKVEGNRKDMHIEINQFMEQFDKGNVLQVYKKNDRLVMELTPVVNRWLWYAIIIDCVLFALLLTKVMCLW